MFCYFECHLDLVLILELVIEIASLFASQVIDGFFLRVGKQSLSAVLVQWGLRL